MKCRLVLAVIIGAQRSLPGRRLALGGGVAPLAAVILLLAAPAGAGAAGLCVPGPRPSQPHPVTVYVVSVGSASIPRHRGYVTPILAAGGIAAKRVRIGLGPSVIAISPDGKTAYVVNAGSGNVTPIRTATNSAGKPIKVGDNPEAIAIAP